MLHTINVVECLLTLVVIYLSLSVAIIIPNCLYMSFISSVKCSTCLSYEF
jgi:hypothetical protein